MTIHRRTVLQLFAGLAVPGRPGWQPAGRGRNRIVIAGGGILGPTSRINSRGAEQR